MFIFKIISGITIFILCLGANASEQQNKKDACGEDLNCHVVECGDDDNLKTYLCHDDPGKKGGFGCDFGGKDPSAVTGDPNGTQCKKLPILYCHTGDVLTEISGNKVTIWYGKNSWHSGALETGQESKEFGKETYDIRCKSGGDLTMGYNEKYVSIRHGRRLDLFWFIGVSNDGLVPIFVRLQDGKTHGVIHTPRGPLIRFGNKKDINIQYCFDGKIWTSSHVVRNNERLDYKCNNNYVSFFNGTTVSYESQKNNDEKEKIVPSLVPEFYIILHR